MQHRLIPDGDIGTIRQGLSNWDGVGWVQRYVADARSAVAATLLRSGRLCKGACPGTLQFKKNRHWKGARSLGVAWTFWQLVPSKDSVDGGLRAVNGADVVKTGEI